MKGVEIEYTNRQGNIIRAELIEYCITWDIDGVAAWFCREKTIDGANFYILSASVGSGLEPKERKYYAVPAKVFSFVVEEERKRLAERTKRNRSRARAYDNVMNEGGEGFNPF